MTGPSPPAGPSRSPGTPPSRASPPGTATRCVAPSTAPRSHGTLDRDDVWGLKVRRRRGGGKSAALSLTGRDRKSTRLNSSHVATSYAVFASDLTPGQHQVDLVVNGGVDGGLDDGCGLDFP